MEFTEINWSDVPTEALEKARDIHEQILDGMKKELATRDKGTRVDCIAAEELRAGDLVTLGSDGKARVLIRPFGIPEPRSEAEKGLVGRPMTEEEGMRRAKLSPAEEQDQLEGLTRGHMSFPTVRPQSEPPHMGSGGMKPTPGRYFVDAEAKRGPRGKRGKAGPQGPAGPAGLRGEPGADHSAEIDSLRHGAAQAGQCIRRLEHANAVQTELIAHQSNRLSEAFAQIRGLVDQVKAIAEVGKGASWPSKGEGVNHPGVEAPAAGWVDQ